MLKSNNLETYFDNVNNYFPSVVKNNILQSVFNQQQIKPKSWIILNLIPCPNKQIWHLECMFSILN